MQLDNKDYGILMELQENARLSTHKISKKLGIPITTVHNRIKKMEKEGIIDGYTAVLNFEKLGYHIFAFILITVNPCEKLGKSRKIPTQEEFAIRIQKFQEVVETAVVTGTTDIVTKVRVRDVKHLNNFIDRLRGLEFIDKTQTLVVLASRKREGTKVFIP